MKLIGSRIPQVVAKGMIGLGLISCLTAASDGDETPPKGSVLTDDELEKLALDTKGTFDLVDLTTKAKGTLVLDEGAGDMIWDEEFKGIVQTLNDKAICISSTPQHSACFLVFTKEVMIGLSCDYVIVDTKDARRVACLTRKPFSN